VESLKLLSLQEEDIMLSLKGGEKKGTGECFLIGEDGGKGQDTAIRRGKKGNCHYLSKKGEEVSRFCFITSGKLEKEATSTGIVPGARKVYNDKQQGKGRER